MKAASLGIFLNVYVYTFKFIHCFKVELFAIMDSPTWFRGTGSSRKPGLLDPFTHSWSGPGVGVNLRGITVACAGSMSLRGTGVRTSPPIQCVPLNALVIWRVSINLNAVYYSFFIIFFLFCWRSQKVLFYLLAHAGVLLLSHCRK